MILVDLIAWLIFVYLVYSVLYRIIIVFNSSRGRLTDIEKREYETKYFRKITILIYSHNNSQKVKALVESFSKQTYLKDYFSLNVILDNCDSENTKLLEILGGTRLWRVNTDIKPIGKYKAFAWLIERIRAFENTNAFVFMDAESIIKSDFLEKINLSLNENKDAVIAGETIKRKNFFYNNFINLKNKINNRVIRHGRFYSSLGNVIDTDVLVIKQEILEKLDFNITEYGYEEYEYPIKLKYYNIPIVYSNDITVHKKQEETLKSLAIKGYQKRYKSFKTFLNNFNLLFSKSKLSVKELVLSYIYPSGTLFVFMNLVLIYISVVYSDVYFSKTISTQILLLLLFLRFFSEFQSILAMRGNSRDYYFAAVSLLLSPVVCVMSIITGFFSKNKIKKEKKGINPGVVNFEKNTIEAKITNGKKEFPCNLEITKGDESSRVDFIFNDKRLKSSKHPRISYAIEEIVDKLKEHSFSLKICSNCGYFYITESTAAHSDGEKGYCLYRNFKEYSKDKESTPVWGSCRNIIPCQARNYILQELGIEKNTFKN